MRWKSLTEGQRRDRRRARRKERGSEWKSRFAVFPVRLTDYEGNVRPLKIWLERYFKRSRDRDNAPPWVRITATEWLALQVGKPEQSAMAPSEGNAHNR